MLTLVAVIVELHAVIINLMTGIVLDVVSLITPRTICTRIPRTIGIVEGREHALTLLQEMPCHT